MTIRLTAEAADRSAGLTLGELAEFVGHARTAGADDGNLVKAKITMRGRIRELTLVPADE